MSSAKSKYSCSHSTLLLAITSLILHQCEQELQRYHQQSCPQAQAFITWILYLSYITATEPVTWAGMDIYKKLCVLLKRTHWHCNTGVHLLRCLDCTALLYDRRAWIYHIPHRHYTHAGMGMGAARVHLWAYQELRVYSSVALKNVAQFDQRLFVWNFALRHVRMCECRVLCLFLVDLPVSSSHLLCIWIVKNL